MARTCRIPDFVVLRCAQELRQAQAWKGAPLHFGRGRPPKGAIGFARAIAQRTGYSDSIIRRVLAARSRAGQALPGGTRIARGLSQLPRSELIKAIQSLWQIAADRMRDGAEMDPLLDERLEVTRRLERLVDVLAGPAPGLAGSIRPDERVRAAAAALWAAAPTLPPSPDPAGATPDGRQEALQALQEALAWALNEDGALPAAMRGLAESLDRAVHGLTTT
jgi:hypothetical protein